MNIPTWQERYISGVELGYTKATDAMQAEIDELRAALKALADNPEFDGIENANPAWWRGHWHSAEVFCQKVNEILDGKDDGSGVGNPPWEPTRRRLLALKAQPVQEPVAWRIWSPDGTNVYQYTEDGDGEPLYTAPVQPALNYEPLHKFAADNRVSYNELCTAVQSAVRTGGAG